MRKKAKYLHDAPNEALIPGFAHAYHMNGSQSMSSIPNAAVVSPSHVSVSQAPTYFVPSTPHQFPQYGPVNQARSMGPPSIDSSSNLVHTEYGHHETPMPYPSVSSQQVSPAQELSSSLDQSGTIGPGANPSFDQAFIDPNDASLFNFNVTDLNFGNHYGALEFGMLGHMSSGAVNTPDIESMNQLGHHHGSISYESSSNYPPGMGYTQSYSSWQAPPGSRQGSTANVWGQQNQSLEAFAIGEHPPSLSAASPRSQGDAFIGYQNATVSPETQFAQPEQPMQSELLRHSLSQQAQQYARKQGPFPGEPGADVPRTRTRPSSSEIYSSVNSPYPYTQSFHSLIACLKRRFSHDMLLRIARALGKIRPSFISCNKNLDREDLIFMEKGLQRTLCEYEEFLTSSGTPTVICRRSGEIAYASKEFCLVTGWKRDVLLGKEPNLNVNTGVMSSGTHTGASTRGAATPRIPPNADSDPARPQPVFLAELMDDDSVVQFYEHFAELAFGASRTSMIGLSASIFKYRTKHDPPLIAEDAMVVEDGTRSKPSGDRPEPLVKSEAGTMALGDKSGRVDCTICWTLKRDMFDNPSLIVINVSLWLGEN